LTISSQEQTIPHQCVHCSKIIEVGSREILEGCNDCHGNHGAMPPGLTSVTHICGSCHLNNMEFFTHTKMAKAFEGLNFHGCEQCHGYHSIQKASNDFVGVGPKSFCTKCHVEGEPGYDAAKLIRTDIMGLVTHLDSANLVLVDVQSKGMNDIDINFLLQDNFTTLN